MKIPFIFAAAMVSLFAISCSPSVNPSSTQKPSLPEIESREKIHAFIDRWHVAAATANGNTFFGSMADSSIYIGTDASERWTKPAFMTFAKPYFDRGRAWDFKPYDRDLHVTNDGQIVWFSELLTTWMGVCRGSGVLRKTSDGWKIEQYHLSVTVPNDIIKDFISLVENYDKQKK